MNKRYTEKEISELKQGISRFLKDKMPIRVATATGLSKRIIADMRDFPEKNRNTKTLDKLSKYMEDSKL